MYTHDSPYTHNKTNLRFTVNELKTSFAPLTSHTRSDRSTLTHTITKQPSNTHTHYNSTYEVRFSLFSFVLFLYFTSISYFDMIYTLACVYSF